MDNIYTKDLSIGIFVKTYSQNKEDITNISKGKNITVESPLASAPNFYSEDRSYIDKVYDNVSIVRAKNYKPPFNYKNVMKDKYRMSDSNLDYTARSNF